MLGWWIDGEGQELFFVVYMRLIVYVWRREASQIDGVFSRSGCWGTFARAGGLHREANHETKTQAADAAGILEPMVLESG